MPFFDLFFLAAIAIFLGFRLWSILGQTHDGVTTASPKPTTIDLKATKTEIHEPFELDQKQFLQGAKKAFEMITAAFASGELKTLRPLLAEDMYETFQEAIKERVVKKQVLETELIRLVSATITNIETHDALATVTVKFVSEQTSVIKDQEGQLVEGNPELVSTMEDLWTFEKDLTSHNPNWRLVETETPQA